MNTSGDAAEQIVRLSIEGIEMAAKIVGGGAKELTTFLFAALSNPSQQKQQSGSVLKGRESLSAMLRSGKELKVFALKEADLKAFCRQAKEFGVGYHVVRHKSKELEGICDVMVSTEQASLAARIIEGFGYEPVDRATLQAQVERDRGVQKKDPAVFQQELAEKDAKRGAQQTLTRPEGASQVDPTTAREKNSAPAPGSAPKSNSGEPSSRTAASKKPSVKKRIEGIVADLKRKPPTPAPQHQPPKKSRKKKPKGKPVVPS